MANLRGINVARFTIRAWRRTDPPHPSRLRPRLTGSSRSSLPPRPLRSACVARPRSGCAPGSPRATAPPITGSTAAEDEAKEIVQVAQTEATRLRESARSEAEQHKTTAASEALAAVGRAQEEADKTVAEAQAAATKTREDAEQQSREMLREARATAGDVRTEGLEIVANLREMGDSLRSNAERLLRDVQLVYSRMVAQLDRVDGGLPPGARSGTPISARRGTDGRTSTRSSARNRPDDLDVPEFIPPS